MEFITAYGPKLKVALDFDPDEGMTEQHHKDECDINNIVRRYDRSGVIQHLRQVEGRYTDVTSVEFHEAMNIVASANSAFEELPSNIRAHFRNDPAAFMDFVHDPNNKDQLVRMGLAKQTADLDDLVELEKNDHIIERNEPKEEPKAPPPEKVES